MFSFCPCFDLLRHRLCILFWACYQCFELICIPVTVLTTHLHFSWEGKLFHFSPIRCHSYCLLFDAILTACCCKQSGLTFNCSIIFLFKEYHITLDVWSNPTPDPVFSSTVNLAALNWTMNQCCRRPDSMWIFTDGHGTRCLPSTCHILCAVLCITSDVWSNPTLDPVFSSTEYEPYDVCVDWKSDNFAWLCSLSWAGPNTWNFTYCQDLSPYDSYYERCSDFYKAPHALPWFWRFNINCIYYLQILFI